MTAGEGVSTMKSLLILSTSFPYGKGEQFLESELANVDLDIFDVTIFPLVAVGEPRAIPRGVQVDLSVANVSSLSRTIIGLSQLLRKSRAGTLPSLKEFGFSPQAGKVLCNALWLSSRLQQRYETSPSPEILYSYWGHFPSYAVAITDFDDRNTLRICRAHGSDLYRGQSADKAALKPFFWKRLDRIFTVSDIGAKYSRDEYGCQAVSVARLGVSLPEPTRVFGETRGSSVQLISVSSVSAVKNVDKIASVVGCFAAQHPSLDVTWVHFGDGPLMSGLRKQVLEAEATISNLRIELKGHKPNPEVLQFLDENSIDAVINLSSSEGIPVSLMECMARGIPAIATDVGASSELVAGSGCLVSPQDSAETVASVVSSFIQGVDYSERRSQARSTISAAYDSKVNFRKFYDELARLSKSKRYSGEQDTSSEC